MKKEGFFGRAKHFFVRTRHNKGTPHLLRTEALAFFLGLTVLSQILLYSGALRQVTAFLPNLKNMVATVLPGVLSYQTNEYRQQNQVIQLSENPLLAQAAAMKAKDMAAKGYFSHLGPDNEKPWVWMQKAGYRYSYAGENLAINFVDSSDVTKAWINSPAHRKNLVNPRFTETGIGTAEGMYEGRPTIFVVQFFAAPAGGSADMPVRTNTIAVATKPAATSTGSVVALALVGSAADSIASSRPIPFGRAAATTSVAVSAATTTEAASSSDSSSTTTLAVGSVDAFGGVGTGTEPAVLGVASDASLSSGEESDAVVKIFSALFVNPRQAAKNILLGMSLLVIALLVISISHTAGNHKPEGVHPTSAHGIASKLGATLGAHKRHFAEVFCVILVLASVWTLGNTPSGESARVPEPTSATSEDF
ncbi:MAG TPA: CAP domain-containing protein [Candidatus Paceibacterota bacterium]